MLQGSVNGPRISPLGTPACGSESGPRRYCEFGSGPGGIGGPPPLPACLGGGVCPAGGACCWTGACARIIAIPAITRATAYVAIFLILELLGRLSGGWARWKAGPQARLPAPHRGKPQTFRAILRHCARCRQAD